MTATPPPVVPNPYEGVFGSDPPAPREFENPYAEMFRRDQAEEDRALAESLSAAAQGDPDVAAEAQRVSLRVGADPEMVMRDLPRWKGVLRSVEAERWALSRLSPVLRRQMTDPAFARLAYDDLDQLGAFERVGEAWSQGMLQAELGQLDSKRRDFGLTPAENVRAEAINAYLQANQLPGGFLRDTAQVLGQFFYTLPEAIETGLATGLAAGGAALYAGQLGPQIALPEEIVTVPFATAGGFFAGITAKFMQQSYQQEGGQIYRDMLADGIDERTAQVVSRLGGAINAGLESVGAGLLARGAGFSTGLVRRVFFREVSAKTAAALRRPTISAVAREFAVRYLEGVGGEVATEAAQETVSILSEELGRAVDGQQSQFSTPEGQRAAAERIGDIIAKTARGTALIALPLPGARFLAESRHIRRVKADQAAFQQLAGTVEAGKLQGRSPEQLGALGDNVLGSGRVANTFVPAERFVEVLQQVGMTREELAQELPEIAQQLPEALETGGDVVIPTGQYAARVVGTKLDSVLRQHIRFDPDGYSLAELPQVLQAQKELETESVAALDQHLTENEEAAAVQRRVESELRGTGLVHERVARDSAVAWRAFVETQAHDLRISPAEFDRQFPIRVTRAEAPKGSSTTAEFDLATGEIRLFQRANVTSVLHEMAHAFLAFSGEVASREGAPTRIQQNFDAFLRWQGLEGGVATWKELGLDGQRSHHEAFAEAFETYGLEGRAPSLELQRVFSNFRRWITRLWRNLTGKQELAPEIRQVFDRMLASDEEIAHAQAVRGLVPLFHVKPEKWTAAEWERYQQHIADADEAAVQEVAGRSLRNMQWLRNAGSKKIRELQAQHDQLREQIRQEVQQEVEAEPARRAADFVRRGRLVDEFGLIHEHEGPHKLQTDAVREILHSDPDARVDLRSLSITSPDGLAPDVVADLFGFPTGRDLVQAIAQLRPLDEVVAEQVDARMLREHGDLVDAKSVQQAVDEALHTPARARAIATELRGLERSGAPWYGSSRIVAAAARQAALATLERMPVSQIKAWRFQGAEGRARREALRAVSKANTADAITAVRTQLFQHEMARAARDIEREVERAQATWQRFRQPAEKIGRYRDVDIVGLGRAILDARQGQQAEPIAQLLQNPRLGPETKEELLGIVSRLTEDRRDPRALELGEFRTFQEGLDALWTRALRERQILVDGKREEVRLIAGRVRDALRPPDRPSLPTSTATPGERRRISFGSVLADIRHWESWVFEQDGGRPGVVHRYLFAPLREAFDRYGLEKRRRVQDLTSRARALKINRKQSIAAPELGGFVFRSKRELLLAIAHSGSISGTRKLLLGRDWIEQPAVRGGPINETPWWQFMGRMIEEGVITKPDMDFVQFMWDQFNDLFPRAQEVHQTLYGFRAEEVKARPITTPWGEYRGGYFPAKIDREETLRYAAATALDDPARAARKEEMLRTLAKIESGDDMVSTSRDFRESMPSTGRGFMESRVEVNLPLALDLRVAANALDEHLRFIHLQEPGRDIQRLMRDPQLADTIRRIDPHAIDGIFLPWLRDTLQNRVMKSGGSPWVDSMLTTIRRNTGMALMFGNLRVAVQQVSGIANSLQYVGLGALRNGLYQWVSNPRAFYRDIVKASDFMRSRLEDAAGQITDDAEILDGSGWLHGAREWTRRHGHFLQRWFQVPVDLVTWAGAHDEAIARGASPQEAIRQADAIVRRSQASGLAPDISRYERSTPFVRIFTQFNTYWLAALNSLIERPTPQRFGLIIGLVGLTSGALAKALEGGWGDDDQDGEMWDDVASWAFGETFKTGAALLPAPLGRILAPGPGGRISFGAAIGQAENARRAVATLLGLPWDPDPVSGSDLRDFGTLLSQLTGLPVSAVGRAAGYARDVQQHRKPEPQNLVGRVSGLIIGK